MKRLNLFQSLLAAVTMTLCLFGCGQPATENEKPRPMGKVRFPMEIGDSCDDLLEGECWQLRGMLRLFLAGNTSTPIALISTPDGQYSTPSNWEETTGLPIGLEVGDYLVSIGNGIKCTPSSPPTGQNPQSNCYRLYDCNAAGAGDGIGGVVGCTPIQNFSETTTPGWPLVPFSVTAGETTTVSFSFFFGEIEFDFGAGEIEVGFTVDKLECPSGQIALQIPEGEPACYQICDSSDQCEPGLCLFDADAEDLEPGQGLCGDESGNLVSAADSDAGP